MNRQLQVQPSQYRWLFELVLASFVVVVVLTTSNHDTTTMMTSLQLCQAFPIVQVPQQQQVENRQRSFVSRSTAVASSASDSSETETITKLLVTQPQQYTLDGQEIRQEIVAMNNHIFVKVKEALSTTTGGIVLPDQSKQRPTEGTVIATGPGKLHPFTGTLIPNPITVGMNVIYGQFDGKAVVYNDEECQVIRDDNVLLAYPNSDTALSLENATPINDNVLIELITPSNNNNNNNNDNDPVTTKSGISTNSGIVLAASVLKDTLPCEGRVIKVGPGRILPNDDASYSSYIPVQINDIVKFKEYAGNDIYIEGKQYSVVKMVDILCTYKQQQTA